MKMQMKYDAMKLRLAEIELERTKLINDMGEFGKESV